MKYHALSTKEPERFYHKKHSPPTPSRTRARSQTFVQSRDGTTETASERLVLTMYRDRPGPLLPESGLATERDGGGEGEGR